MRRSLQSVGVYVIAGSLPRSIALITLPLYTRFLSPSEYGTFSLLVTVAAGVAILLALGLDVAFFRLYFRLASTPERQRAFVGSVWSLLIVVPLTVSLVIGACAIVFIHHARFTGVQLLLALIGAAVGVAATTVPFSALRAEQRLADYMKITTVATLANSGLSVLMVVGFKWGITGWLSATIIANTATLVVSALVVPFHFPRPFDRELLRHALGFGGPLVPHAFAHWALQVADRSVIAGMVSRAALGVYSLGSNLGLPVLMLVQSVNFAFVPSYARAGTEASGDERLSDIVNLQAAAVAFIVAGCSLLGPPFIRLVIPGSYGAAAPLVPWIALGYGFLGLYYIPMNGISLGGGRTRFAAVTSLTAAATNIGLLYLLVPGRGIYWAAIASALAYAALLVAVFIYANRPENPIVYDWKTLIAVGAIVSVAYVAGAVYTSDSSAVGLAERCALLVAASSAFAITTEAGRTRVFAWRKRRAGLASP